LTANDNSNPLYNDKEPCKTLAQKGLVTEANCKLCQRHGDLVEAYETVAASDQCKNNVLIKVSIHLF
jgi:hypothetical protein